MVATLLLMLIVCLCYLATAQTFDPSNCPVVNSTSTEYPPVLNNPASSLSANKLTVNWIWSITSTRSIIPSFQFGTCAYGTPDVSIPASACSLNQSASIDWAFLITNCGWTQLTTGQVGTDIQYGGNFTVNGTETLVNLRGQNQTRTLSYTFLFVISLPQSVTVDTNIQVFSPILLDSFVITQYYTPTTANGTVDFGTMIEYPWKVTLTNNTVYVNNGTKSGTVASVSPYSTNPGTTATALGTISNQNFEMQINPGSGLCFLDDSYTIYATLECVLADKTLCPTLAGSPDVSITFSIRSESFCVSSNNDVHLEGILRVFDDPAYSNVKTQFVLGTESYFELAVSSPAVTVTNIIIDSVFLTCSTPNLLAQPINTQVSSWTLYSAGTWKSNAGITATMEAPIGADQKFHFSLNDRLFSIPQDSALNFVITAKANVTYLGTGGVKRESLFTFALDTKNQVFGSVLGITAPKATQQRTSSSAFSSIASFQLMLLAFWLFLI